MYLPARHFDHNNKPVDDAPPLNAPVNLHVFLQLEGGVRIEATSLAVRIDAVLPAPSSENSSRQISIEIAASDALTRSSSDYETAQTLWWALDAALDFKNVVELPQNVPAKCCALLGGRLQTRRIHIQLFRLSSNTCPFEIPFPRQTVQTTLEQYNRTVSHPARQPYEVLSDPIYARQTTSLGPNTYFRFDRATIEDHLQVMHEWWNNPRVDKYWNDAGTLEEHKDLIQKKIDDPHNLSVIGSYIEPGEQVCTPATYFEIYWCLEDRIGGFYDADDYDRGIHILVGNESYRGPHRVDVWLPSLCHFIFTDDCRTRRVICEPNHKNEVMIKYLEKYKFKRIRNFDFPHKRAALMILERDDFWDMMTQ